MVQRFEVTIQTRYFERLIALVTKIYRRMFHMVRSRSHSCVIDTKAALSLVVL